MGAGGRRGWRGRLDGSVTRVPARLPNTHPPAHWQRESMAQVELGGTAAQ